MLVVTYKHYLKYKELYERKEVNCVAEEGEEYIYDTSNEHDKVFRDILNVKEEALSLINRALKPKKKIVEDIELYNNKFVTSVFKYREADIIYKVKNKNIFFLIEHQSTIDYSIAYRMMEYSIEIMRRIISEEYNKKKSYKYPLIIPIIFYTGEKNWDAKLRMEDLKEKVEWYEDNGEISLVDINNYTEEELLEENNVLSKNMILEKSRNEVDFIENVLKILKKCSSKEFERLSRIIKYKAISIGKEDEIEEILSKIKIKEEDIMTFAERIKKNEMEERMKAKDEGKKEGIKEGMKKGVNKTIRGMILKNIDENIIKDITGIKDKELEKMKKELMGV